MSLAISILFQGYIDHHCTWKGFRDTCEKPKRSIFHVVCFPLISQKRFHVQRGLIYPQTCLGKAGDIGYFNFQSVPFSILKNVENGTWIWYDFSFRWFFHGRHNFFKNVCSLKPSPISGLQELRRNHIGRTWGFGDYAWQKNVWKTEQTVFCS